MAPRATTVVVPMTTEDLPQVLAIHGASFLTPWSEESFRAEIALKWSNVDVLKEVRGGAVLAVVTYWIVSDEVQLLNITSAPSRRREGASSLLMNHVFTRGEEAGCRRIVLEVRPSNTAALEFYRRFGFTQVGRRPRYYSSNQEDALLLGRPLDPVRKAAGRR